MTGWQVRHEGSPTATPVASAQRVLEGLRDGEWEPADEVRGPADRAWVAIEDHPTFAEAVADLEPHEAEKHDETHLDMNPLIDVSLVLLIFFILTTTYASLRRAIDLPPEPTEKQGQKTQVVKPDDIKDRVFKVKVRMEDGKPVVRIEDKVVPLPDLETEMLNFVKSTGRKELYADIAGDVPWGVEAKLYDAAKAADIHQIYWPKGK